MAMHTMLINKPPDAGTELPTLDRLPRSPTSFYNFTEIVFKLSEE